MGSEIRYSRVFQILEGGELLICNDMMLLYLRDPGSGPEVGAATVDG